jgi:membrane glycosyltransferase
MGKVLELNGAAQGASSAPQPTAGRAEDAKGRLPTHWGRLLFFYLTAALLTGGVSVLFADFLWRTGWSASRTVLLLLFGVLTFFSAAGCTHGIFGFVARRFGGRGLFTQDAESRSRSLAGTRTAIIFPIYNEDMPRVCEGLRATYESLRQTGRLEHFDFFILSDSNRPEQWLEEEQGWCELVGDLAGQGRIFYRRRFDNEDKKSGNVRDFLSAWGARYDYFIVLDADSVMRGETIVALVQLMEAHPAAGLISSAAVIVNADSLFGRIQQFANRLYSPIFNAGLDYWAQDFGNYWGHNAIIRTAPFMQHAILPHLPGPKPFGGSVLSHDFVEAALLVKENWEVGFAYDLTGSYEENPQDMIENAQRDRRWCQGNLQHALVQCARGLRGASRLHLLFGTCMYLAGPLWLALLVLSNAMLWFKWNTGLSDIAVHSFTQFLNLSAPREALLLFGLCLAMLFLPKVLALVDLALDRERRRAFGGLATAAAGIAVETVFSALHAPLQMLWHTRFVFTILLGQTVHWGPQSRGAAGISWATAFRQHWPHTVLGLVWGGFNWLALPATFWWFVPVLTGMVVSIPLCVLSSRSSWGRRARDWRLLLTPEETAPPLELASLRAWRGGMKERRRTAQHHPL